MARSTQFKVEFNSTFPTATSIMRYAGTTHGISLIALSMIEQNNKKLDITVTFDGDTQLNAAATHVMAILKKSDSVPVYLRTVKTNGVFESKYGDAELQTNDVPPTSPDEFPSKSGAILDLSITHNTQTWTFYRLHDPHPRHLKLVLGGV